MDGSRDADLYLLKQRMEDESLSRLQRRRARRSFDSIRLQIKDRTLTDLRHRLIRAVQANDKFYIEALEHQIKEHTYRKGYERYVEA